MVLHSFEQEDVADIFELFTIDGTTNTETVGIAVSSLPTTPPSGKHYFKDTGSDSLVEACAGLPDGKTATAQFRRSDNTTYSRPSNIFILGHPRPRPN